MSNVSYISMSHEDAPADSYWPRQLCQAIYFASAHSVMGVRCNLKADHYPDTKHKTATGTEWVDMIPAKTVIAVIATSQMSGKSYIKALGLENCEVFTDERHLEGRRIKGVIITPGYLSWLLDRALAPLAIVDAANIHADGLNAPRG